MKGNHTRPTNILLMEEIMHHHGMYKILVKTVISVMFFHIDFWTINGTILHRRTAGPWHVKDKDSPWRPYLLMQWIVSFFLRLECWVALSCWGRKQSRSVMTLLVDSLFTSWSDKFKRWEAMNTLMRIADRVVILLSVSIKGFTKARFEMLSSKRILYPRGAWCRYSFDFSFWGALRFFFCWSGHSHKNRQTLCPQNVCCTGNLWKVSKNHMNESNDLH